eukprot:4235491-Pyramimonas_sp.AAC.2
MAAAVHRPCPAHRCRRQERVRLIIGQVSVSGNAFPTKTVATAFRSETSKCALSCTLPTGSLQYIRPYITLPSTA